MPISVVFDPPLPSDSPSTFNNKAFTLLGDLNDWSTQANALPGEVATNLSALLAAPPAIGSTTPAAGSFTTLSVNTVSTDVKAVVGSSVAKATTASTEVVWVKSSDTSNALTLAIGINSNATDTSRGVYLQSAEQGVAYRNLLIQPDGGNIQIGSPSGTGAVTIPGSVGIGRTATSKKFEVAGQAFFQDATQPAAYFGNTFSDYLVALYNPVTKRGSIAFDGTGVTFGIDSNTTPRFSIDTAGAVTIPGSLSLTGGTFGYGTGAGGTVTQATSKSTAVTLNKPSGQITMNNAALGAGAEVQFAVNNTFAVPGGMAVACQHDSAIDTQRYQVRVAALWSGAFAISVKNLSGVSQSDALVINFQVHSGATS